MSTQSSTRKKAMLQALEKSMGVVTAASKIAGIDRKTHYNWMKKDSRYREAVDELQNIALDFAESKLFKNIEKSREASIFFYLKTKGKKRGYVERQEVVHEGDISAEVITIQVNEKKKD